MLIHVSRSIPVAIHMIGWSKYNCETPPHWIINLASMEFLSIWKVIGTPLAKQFAAGRQMLSCRAVQGDCGMVYRLTKYVESQLRVAPYAVENSDPRGMRWWQLTEYMMTSSNGNIFRVTGHWCEECTGHRWIPRTMKRSVDVFFHLRLNRRLSKYP